MVRSIPFLIFSIIFACLAVSCGDSDPEIDHSNSLTSTSNIISAVRNDFVPDSLSFTEGHQSPSFQEIMAMPENPCAGIGLFICQPILLKLYVGLAQNFLELTQEITSSIGGALGNQPVGASGNFSDSGYDYTFSRPAENELTILVERGGEAVNNIAIDGNSIALNFNLDRASGDNEGRPGALQVNLTYASEDNWEITVFVLNIDECRAEDPRAPESIHVYMKREDNLWTGKATTYHPRWGDQEPDCSADPGAGELGIMTDFVGNQDAAKVEVYFVPIAVTDLNDIKGDSPSYAIDQICNHFPICDTPPDNFPIPYCNPANASTAEWGDDCNSISTDVSEADFSPLLDWVLPANLREMAI